MKLNSTVRLTSDGTVQRVDLTYDVQDGDEVLVYFNDDVILTGWTLQYNTKPQRVDFDEEIPAGTVVLIRRITDMRELPHHFHFTGNAKGGAEFNGKNLDENFDKILRAAQDAMDSFELVGINLEAESYAKHYAEQALVEANRAQKAADDVAAIIAAGVDHQDLHGRNKPNSHDASAIGFKQGGGGAVESNVQNKLMEWVHVRDFGVVGDGTDETEKLRLAHNAANSLRVPVSYEGVDKVYVQADAKIIVNTSIISGNCTLSLLDGYDPDITAWVERRKTLFIVEDENTPLTELDVSNEIIASRFYKGSKEYLDFMDSGYVSIVISGFRVPSRNDDSTRSLVIPAYLQKGVSNLPLFTDLRDSVSSVVVKFRENSYGRIDLGDFNIELNESNNQEIFKIKRNQVDFGLTWDKEILNEHSCCSLVKIEDAGDFEIRRLTGPGTDSTDGRPRVASYVLFTFGVSKLRVRNMWCSKKWAHMGNSQLSDFEITDSEFFRLDAHEHGYDIRARRCKLHSQIQYGSGGGTWHFEQIELNQTPTETHYSLIKNRGDYGPIFFGEITLRDITVRLSDTSTLSLIDFGSVGSTQVLAPMAETIKIEGVSIYLYEGVGSPKKVSLFKMGRKSTEARYSGARLISLKDFYISSEREVETEISISPGTSNIPNRKGKFVLEGFSSSGNISLNFVLPSATSSDQWMDITLKDISDEIDVSFFCEDNTLFSFHADGVSKLKKAESTKWPRNFRITNSTIDCLDQDGAKFGSAGANTYYNNSMVNCVVYGSPDLSGMTSMQGVLFRVRGDTPDSDSITSTPILPDGATIDSVFTGWKKQNTYK